MQIITVLLDRTIFSNIYRRGKRRKLLGTGRRVSIQFDVCV